MIPTINIIAPDGAGKPGAMACPVSARASTCPAVWIGRVAAGVSAIGQSDRDRFAYEIGERRISAIVLERLARLFRLTIDQLLGFAPEPIRKGRLLPRAMRHAERLQALSKTQQRFVVRIIDVLEGYNKR